MQMVWGWDKVRFGRKNGEQERPFVVQFFSSGLWGCQYLYSPGCALSEFAPKGYGNTSFIWDYNECLKDARYTSNGTKDDGKKDSSWLKQSEYLIVRARLSRKNLTAHQRVKLYERGEFAINEKTNVRVKLSPTFKMAFVAIDDSFFEERYMV